MQMQMRWQADLHANQVMQLQAEIGWWRAQVHGEHGTWRQGTYAQVQQAEQTRGRPECGATPDRRPRGPKSPVAAAYARSCSRAGRARSKSGCRHRSQSRAGKSRFESGDETDDEVNEDLPINWHIDKMSQRINIARAAIFEIEQYLARQDIQGNELPAEPPTERRARLKLHDIAHQWGALNADLDWIEEHMYADETLESRAGDALERMEVIEKKFGKLAGLDELEQSVTTGVRAVLDLLVLACSRAVDLTLLEEQGYPDAMRDRLLKALQCSNHEEISVLWSRIGKAKYHIFSPGKTWGKRKPKIRKCGRRVLESNLLDSPA